MWDNNYEEHRLLKIEAQIYEIRQRLVDYVEGMTPAEQRLHLEACYEK